MSFLQWWSVHTKIQQYSPLAFYWNGITFTGEIFIGYEWENLWWFRHRKYSSDTKKKKFFWWKYGLTVKPYFQLFDKKRHITYIFFFFYSNQILGRDIDIDSRDFRWMVESTSNMVILGTYLQLTWYHGSNAWRRKVYLKWTSSIFTFLILVNFKVR